VSCIFCSSFRGCTPFSALRRNAICRVSLLQTKISLGVRVHVAVEHRVKIGRNKSLFVGAGNTLVVVKNVQRFDEHFKPIVLQNNLGNVDSLGLSPIVRRRILDIETSFDEKFSHGTKKNRLGCRVFKINLSRVLVSFNVRLVGRINLNVLGAQEISVANISPGKLLV
jgi:hypothetical protein